MRSGGDHGYGQIIAQDTPNRLIASLGASHVVEFAIDGDQRPLQRQIDELPGVQAVSIEEREIRPTVSEIHVAVPALMNVLSHQGLELSELSTHTATLEDVFLHHTGRLLRDG